MFFFAGMLAALSILIFRYQHHAVIKTGAAVLVTSLVCMLNDIPKIITRPNESWLYIWLPVGMILSVYYQQKGLIHRKEEHGL
ncbi:MAG: hypothetical protein OXC48_06700 [Endozoicomonadaceae bacterium]|nr:hypothetical protein [Endozoicomonadaceae bacterium]